MEYILVDFDFVFAVDSLGLAIEIAETVVENKLDSVEIGFVPELVIVEVEAEIVGSVFVAIVEISTAVS